MNISNYKKMVLVQTIINIYLILVYYAHVRIFVQLIHFSNDAIMIRLFFVQGIIFLIFSIYYMSKGINLFSKFELMICVINVVISIYFVLYFYIGIFELTK